MFQFIKLYIVFVKYKTTFSIISGASNSGFHNANSSLLILLASTICNRIDYIFMYFGRYLYGTNLHVFASINICSLC